MNASNIPAVTLKPGRDKTARQRHPWIFSGAIAKIEGNPQAGDVVMVVDSDNKFIAYGHYSPISQIRIRLLDWNNDTKIDDAWWYKKIRSSIERRNNIPDLADSNAIRLVYAESDFIPGLIVDKYDDFLIAQFLSCGVDKIKNEIAAILNDIIKPRGIYERSDVEVRKLEGLEPQKGVLSGAEPSNEIIITERRIKFGVDIISGHKTGLYLDQRYNRKSVAEFAAGKKVLDCFCYGGGFSLYALANKCQNVTLVDSSQAALDMANRNVELNGFDLSKAYFVAGDVFEVLRELRSLGKRFDMIILDPPKFAPTKKDLKKALSAYKDINLLALKLLEPDGILATFSCSGAVDSQTLQTVLFWAATDSGRQVQIIQKLSQDIDHPISVTFPESEYLKGFICRVI